MFTDDLPPTRDVDLKPSYKYETFLSTTGATVPMFLRPWGSLPNPNAVLFGNYDFPQISKLAISLHLDRTKGFCNKKVVKIFNRKFSFFEKFSRGREAGPPLKISKKNFA